MSHSSEPDQERIESPSTIYDLNDHVLREAFQYFGDIDLCTIANVCTVFKRNAQAEFSLRYSDKCFAILIQEHVTSASRKNSNGIRVCQLSSVLRNFGSIMKSFKISLENLGCYSSSIKRCSIVVARILNRYCAHQLNDLTLSGFIFRADLGNRHMAGRGWHSGQVKSHMHSVCSQLQKLSIEDPWADLPLFYDCFPLPKLSSLKIRCGDTNESVENFLKVNSQLKELEIVECSEITGDVVRSIVQYTPQIEKIAMLEIGGTTDAGTDFIENAKYWMQLTALKSLKMDCRFRSFLPVIDGLVEAQAPLECLHLINLKADADIFDRIATMNRLKELKFGNIVNFELSNVLMTVSRLTELNILHLSLKVGVTSLVKIVQASAPNLCKLEVNLGFVRNWVLDETHFKAILDAIQERQAIRRFEIKLHASPFWPTMNKVPKDLLKANEKTLKITFD